MPRLESTGKKYSLQDSPFYRLRSRRKFAALLYWKGTAKELEQFAAAENNYRVFNIQVRGKSARVVQEPKEDLQRLHRRIAALLLRIQAPDYLHSGLRGRSFVTNAMRHLNDMPAIKLDVVKFYPSTTWGHVYRFFHHALECSPDVAGLIASLACYRSARATHLPTGSSLSQILAFYAHKTMFDAIYEMAMTRGGVMTVYVDDIVVSMPDASSADIPRVGRIIEKQGLEWHKTRFFPKGVPKRVTGTIVKSDRLEADKKQHFKYCEALAELDDMPPGTSEHRKRARRAIGLLQSIVQVDPRRAKAVAGMTIKLMPWTR